MKSPPIYLIKLLPLKRKSSFSTGPDIAEQSNQCVPTNPGRCAASVGIFWAGALLGVLVLALSAPASAQGQQPLTLKDAVQKAVLSNPEILARWHTLKAAESERDAGAGVLLP